MNVTREGTEVRYMCHRASCGVRGYIGSNGYVQNMSPATKSRPYKGALTYLPDDMAEQLRNTYHLTDYQLFDKLGARWSAEDMRVAYVVRDYRGRMKGHILRSYCGAKPKVLTYRTTDDSTFLAWMPCDTISNKLVLVEDIVSAARASSYVHACALLGTHLSYDNLEEVKQFVATACIDNTVLALDADAFGKSIKMMNTYALHLPMTASMMHKDIKDMTEDEVRRALT